MKKNSLFLIAILFIFISINNVFSQDSEKNKRRYYIESAIINYKISGNTKGEEKIYFDNWGEREAQFTKAVTETTFFGIKNKQEENTLNILDGDISYGIDLKNKTGVKTLNAGITTMSALSQGKSPRQFGKEMLKKMGGKKIGEEEILGKNCEIWKALGTKIWLWKGIPLKTQSKIMGIERTVEAIELNINTKIDESVFKVPEGIKINDYTK